MYFLQGKIEVFLFANMKLLGGFLLVIKVPSYLEKILVKQHLSVWPNGSLR